MCKMNSMSLCGYKGIICKCILIIVNVYGFAQNEMFPRNLKVYNGINQTKCFEKIMENVGVNRAPVRIHLLGRVGDSGRDTFENEN